MEGAALLKGLGSHVRRLRQQRGWSRRELAARSRLSERFLAQVEAGSGNPSVLRLARVASALSTTPAALLADASRATCLALLGVRGAGKSAVGTLLARRRNIPFVELDQRIEEAAGLSLREIFEVHGEESYRRWEREALESLLDGAIPVVIATGGGLVTHADTYDLLRRRAITIWLRASPEEHWDRVVAQGDHRPMANDPLARENLRDLLARREPLYRTADHIVDTSARSVESIASEIDALA
jgi:XRE family transcriptional regulator, aerobic/anaerobic benzoate catabolism transcriptional regulator